VLKDVLIAEKELSWIIVAHLIWKLENLIKPLSIIVNKEKRKEVMATKKYYRNLYYANRLMIAWDGLKKYKSKKNLQAFLIAYHNYSL